jgi:hypothetical protein
MDKTIGPTLQSQVHVGASAWLAKNDAFFNHKVLHSYLHVIFRANHWTNSWSIVPKK